MKTSNGIVRRDLLKRAGLLAAGGGLWFETLFQGLATADEEKPAAVAAAVGRREILKGLDGMSRARS